MRYTKTITLSILCLLSNACAAQVSNVPTSELNALYKAAGLKKRAGKLINPCDEVVQPETQVVDLNGDGQPEVFVSISSGSCYGMAGGELHLFIKDKQGQWKSNLGFPAGDYNLLSTKNKGFPDIEIGGPGSCSPVWRWNGTEYDIHKRCDH